jgi:hypothetical protein
MLQASQFEKVFVLAGTVGIIVGVTVGITVDITVVLQCVPEWVLQFLF